MEAGRPRPLRILADDLTGALDTAAAFGAGVPVWLDRPAGGRPVDIEVLASASRDLPPAALPDALAPAWPWLGAPGVRPWKKVDSLLRGNSFDEVDRCARALGCRHLLFAPALPGQGRETRDGRLWVRPAGGDRPEATPLSLREAMRSRGWRVDAVLPDDAADGGVWLPDVRDDATLQAVVRTVLAREAARPGERWLWVGSAGLAQALAAVGAVPSLAAEDVDRVAPVSGPHLLVSASHHAVSRRQWDRLAQVWPGLAMARAGDLAARDALIRSASPGRWAGFDLAPLDRLTPDEAGRRLDAHADALVRRMPRPAALVVVGGDTLLALCRASGAQAMRSMAAPSQPGWGQARLSGGAWDGVPCLTRSGAFGGDDDLVEVLARS